MQNTPKHTTLAFAMVKLGKNTKALVKHVPTIEEAEIPRIKLTANDGNFQVITYNINDKAWNLFDLASNTTTNFNPTMPSGLDQFLDDYSFENLNNAIKVWIKDTTDVFSKYGVKIPN